MPLVPGLFDKADPETPLCIAKSFIQRSLKKTKGLWGEKPSKATFATP